MFIVLNLIINGIPSILKMISNKIKEYRVLNLIINGIPSILARFNELDIFINSMF